MNGNLGTFRPPSAFLGTLLTCCACAASAQTDSALQRELQQMKEQLKQQQAVIEELNRKVNELQARPVAGEEPATARKSWLPDNFGRVHIGGEGAIGFFNTGSQGPFPNKEFRVDEAKLFLETPIWNDVYFFTEVNIVTREEPDLYLRMGELYLDFENLGRWFGRDRWLNLRVGRFDIPFGEEYLTRDAIDNPLISHSLTDLWGVDEGVELYGCLGNFNYVFAVQNGGHPTLRDYNGDKALAGRLGFNPNERLHFSVSGMRTGDLDVQGDQFSEIWVANSFIRALGNPATTTTFHAELFEGNVKLDLLKGYLKAAAGYIHSDDNDSSGADNQRDLYYYYLEGLFHITPKVYAAARFGQVFAEDGFPLLAGNGDWMRFFMSELTSELSRLSVGVGYRPTENLLLKTDFTYNTGETLSGASRVHENFFGVEAAFKF